MSGPQFFETRMGQQFYDGTMRRLAESAERISVALDQLAARPRQDAPIGAGGYQTQKALLRAALVITKTPTIWAWLQDNDPKALEQLERAITDVINESIEP